MSWSKVTIGSLGKVVTGKTPSTEHDEYYGGSIPFITPKDMVGIRSVETERFLTDSGMENVASSVVPEYTICVSCIGSDMGKVVITQQMSVTNQQINSIIVSSNYDYQFVYYLLYSMKDKIQSLGKNSTAIPILNKAKFSALDIVVPDLPTQHRIASILSAYDDLIENNRRQIKLLEEAAQRLYREWFVELRFPGHEDVKIVDGVPEGWQVVFLGDVIEFDPQVPLSKDRTKQSVPMAALSTSSMVIDQSLIENTMSNSGSKFRNGDTLLARITPCLENGKTAFVDFLDKDEGAVGSTEFIVMRSKILNPYMVYCIARSDSFRTEAINSMTGSDGRQRA